MNLHDLEADDRKKKYNSLDIDDKVSKEELEDYKKKRE
jgi:hypothetical protein